MRAPVSESGVKAEMMTAMTEEDIHGGTGPTLHIRSWPAVGAARGVVLIVPGFNSHGGYYGWVGGQLSAAGLTAYAVDLRGRGRSEGERFYVDAFEDYVSDVASLAAVVKTREKDLPVYLLGHSAGGVVACLYALEHQSELAGLICESFAFRLPAPGIALAVLKGLSHLTPHAHVLRLKNEDFSRDGAIVAAMVRADERLEEALPSITLPLLILHGTADRATRPAGSQLLLDRAGSTDKALKLYDGVFHDPLNDVGRETVMADILAWLDARLRGTSAPVSSTASGDNT